MKKFYSILLITFGVWHPATAQGVFSHGRIIPSRDGHYLQYEDGTSFFWLGDTAWELFHRLRLDEINLYLDNRKAKGFNVIQVAALAEMNGLTMPDQYGDLPLLNQNPETPNEQYFQFVESVVKLAERKDLYIGLLPTWGDKVTLSWGAGPVVFNKINAYKYGFWIASRYKNHPNIIWILGGDRPAMNDSNDWRPVWRAMAKGILDATANKAFITYHPSGGAYSTSQYIHQEPWLEMNMIQSGHGGGHDVPVWSLISRDYELLPRKPVLDSEPNYEDHPVNPWPKWDPATGYYRAYDVRKQLYRSVFSGACGVTYGHHSIWQFYSPREEKINYADRYWTDALDRPGAYQAGYLLKLITSRPYLNRVPDDSMIEKGQGEKGKHMTAFRDSSGSYLMIYLPVGNEVLINTTYLKPGKISVTWFDPRTGEYKKIGVEKRAEHMNFIAPTSGVENDWVLVLDSIIN
ncbi:MAG: glycoside hydrolase family 140 protein [Chitinophagaceae bacterium]